MAVLDNETLVLRSNEDVVLARQTVRKWALKLGFNLVEQTKIVTAASELARNTVIHGGGGMLLLETLNHDDRRGLRLRFEDEGPGIPNIDQALRDGYTTGTGLGLGLGGSKRLANEFEIRSELGKGTRVVFTRWKGN
ncbi:MAG: putative anti-sigma regulatory factor, serine/threonine protein kinase [Bryobacterales bacterium]|nr:putative anti-sigma regulatory factor, serine/threonine protein kinase [Bryobacterales bacterium]